MAPRRTSVGRTAVLTAVTLVAFAANSVLCRLALGEQTIDAASFATLRITSGAVTLALLMIVRGGRSWFRPRGNWSSSALLFFYAVPFSFAYISLSAGTGALILFGSVQATMLLAALAAGERPHFLQWAGLGLALGGLVYLVFPGLTAPSPTGSALMVLAGVSWGFYSLRGRAEENPVAATAGNFMRAAPITVVVSLAVLGDFHLTFRGAGLAIVSGAVTSGIGYVLWYAALRGLTATRAALVQLPVPVLSAAGGVLFLAEGMSLRLLVASAAILGGVWLGILGREKKIPRG